MTDHPTAQPSLLADAALAALGALGDFRTISAVEIDAIHKALERLKQLEESND